MSKRTAQWLFFMAVGGIAAAVMMFCASAPSLVVSGRVIDRVPEVDERMPVAQPSGAVRDKGGFVATPHEEGPIDREVQSALRFAATHAMESPRWGPDLSNSANNRKKYAGLTAGWGPEHYVSILHFLVSRDPAVEKDCKLFIYAARECTAIEARLDPAGGVTVADAYRVSRYVDWLEAALAKKGGMYYASSSWAQNIALLGIKVGGIDREQLMLRILARVRDHGWDFDLQLWYTQVDLSDRQVPPSAAVTEAFQEIVEMAAKDPAIRGLSSQELAAIYIQGWLRAGDPEMKHTMMRRYIALPVERRELYPGSVMMPPGHVELYDMIDARPAGSRDASALAFIRAVLLETEAFDGEFCSLLTRYTGPIRTITDKLLDEELRESFRTRLEAARQSRKN